ncbi:MAG: hypothetical protein R3E12_04265 [Candidatus Eisenbacteria bacterium]
MRVVTLDDVTGDGFPISRSDPGSIKCECTTGGWDLLVWLRAVGTTNGGDVWAIDRMDDVTGDGINDVCAGSFDLNVRDRRSDRRGPVAEAGRQSRLHGARSSRPQRQRMA